MAKSAGFALLLLALAVSSASCQNYTWAETTGLEGTNKIFKEQLAEAQAGNGSQFVLYGDSKLACMQFEASGCGTGVEVRDRRFGALNPLVWAVGGDSAASVLGKILNGVAPVGLGKKSDVAVAMNVGHNGMSKLGPNVTAERIITIADLILDLDKSNQFIYIAMFPSSSQWVGSGMYYPSKVVDQILWDYAKNNSRIHFANCEPMYVDINNTVAINSTLIGDTVHLTPAGLDVLADCLAPFVKNITGVELGPGPDNANMSTTAMFTEPVYRDIWAEEQARVQQSQTTISVAG